MTQDSPAEGTILVIQNSKNSGPRRLIPWLAAHQLSTDIVFATDLQHEDINKRAGIIILGGAPLPNQDIDFPWLPLERDIVAAAVQHSIPTLGICLGAQLLAVVAGGTVERRVLPPEHGMCRITNIPDAAQSDDVFKHLPASYPMTENHVDAITKLPDTAIHLAYSSRCPNQAFKIGSCAWGVQFHPEVSADNIISWDAQEQDAIARDGYNWQELVEGAVKHKDVNTQVAQTLISSFASYCRYAD